MSVAKVNAVRRMARQAISLQSPLMQNEQDAGNIEDILEDENSIHPGDNDSNEYNYNKLYELLR